MRHGRIEREVAGRLGGVTGPGNVVTTEEGEGLANERAGRRTDGWTDDTDLFCTISV